MPENAQTDTLIHTIATRMEIMHGDMGEMKDAVKGLTNAVTKLALIEERQSQTALALERAFKAIERVEMRIMALEQSNPMHNRTSSWVEKILWGAATVGGLVILKKAGVM